MDDVTSPSPIPGSCPCAAELTRLRTQLDALRADLVEGVTTRQVVILDAEGRPRIRLTAGDDGPAIALAEADGHDRVHLAARGDHGHVVVRTRTPEEHGPDGEHPTEVDLFALDAEPDDPGDRPSAGLELIDRGDTTARLSLSEGRHPHLWWLSDPDGDE